MNTLAFVVGLITLGLIKADVSHLQNINRQQTGHFVANNGQVVKQSFNPFQDAGNKQNSNQLWWMNTETLPFTKTHNHRTNENIIAGCNGCASRTLNIKHNTQHQQFNQNPFINAKLQQPSSYNNIHTQLAAATVSGSPSEVNNFFAQSSFNSGRIQQSSACTDVNSACVSQKFCYNGFIDRSAELKAVRSSSGKCFAPEVCCRFAQRKSAQYSQDNSVAAAESTSEILTQEGYVVRKPSNQYLPSVPEYNPAPSNDDPSYIRPTPPPTQPPRTQPPRTQPPRTQPPRTQPPRTQPPRTQPPRTQPPRTQPPRTERPYQPQPSDNRPQYEDAPIVIPTGCPAAMNCTPIEYCSSTAVISKSIVQLTPQQKEFRVPMSDCLEPTTKQQGKCCRDPDYVDPWPVGRTGQYQPDELNAVFDNGAYRPDPTNNVAIRAKPPQQPEYTPSATNNQGYVIPQPSNQRLYLPPSNSILI